MNAELIDSLTKLGVVGVAILVLGYLVYMQFRILKTLLRLLLNCRKKKGKN